MLEPSSELQGLLCGGCYSSLLVHETELRLSCATEVVRGIIFFGVSVTSKRSPSEVVVSVGFRIKGCVRLIVRLLYCFFNVKGCCYWCSKPQHWEANAVEMVFLSVARLFVD